MNISIPELSLVILIGASGSGKSSFAKKHFSPTEILSSDYFRGLVSNDETSLEATNEAFDVLHYVLRKRLAAGLLTVIDATNVQREASQPLLDLAREYHVLPVAIVFNMPEDLCHERNAARLDRQFGKHVVRNHAKNLRQSLRHLDKDFRYIHVLKTPEEIDAVTITRTRVYNNLKHESGPFDIIGDIHGCFAELIELLQKLEYQLHDFQAIPPTGRKAIFLGDLVDRGTDTPSVLKLVMNMVEAGHALCIPGNHDDKLKRYLEGRQVKQSHGLDISVSQLEAESPEFKEKVKTFLDDLISHYVLDAGKLVVAHAGMKESLQGRTSGTVRAFALYGETTGESDEFSLPVRYDWAADYRGKAKVVYGHTPVLEAEWFNNTIDIDTGCVYGGKLSALRYPEMELMSVPAKATYYQLLRFEQQTIRTMDDVLDIADVTGKRMIETRFRKVMIKAEESAAALEVMSRFAIDPRWLIYLPPTMSPSETSNLPEYLEYPTEAFDYFKREGIETVICQEKHMGSRAVTVICQDEALAQKRFGVEAGFGVVYTRTGRRFFNDQGLEHEFLVCIQKALSKADFWNEFKTTWFCLDAELMPWSFKARELLEHQYAAVGAAGQAGLGESMVILEQAKARGLAVDALLEKTRERLSRVLNYREAYRQYCASAKTVDDLKLAPFHLLASEGAVHTDKDHLWHMQTLARLADFDPHLLQATNYKLVHLSEEASCNEAINWWQTLTQTGGEGMVVKPLSFLTQGQRGLTQPAIKCRGSEYLRIIYGPEYDAPEHLERLRSRGLATKRSLALREFTLGLEGLHRFVAGESLRCIHECVFGVLALESEGVDPRL